MCLVDAATGKILWGHEGYTRHVHGQGMCSDIDGRYPGSECYSADTDSSKKFAWARLRTARGEVISEENLGGFSPKCIYWDADVQREILKRGFVSKYRGSTLRTRIEGHIAAVADILGDWREEILMTSPDGRSLRLYTTTMPTENRLYTLMHDPQYRLSTAWQNVVYNKPPHTGFFLGYGMAAAPRPRIRLIGQGEALDGFKGARLTEGE